MSIFFTTKFPKSRYSELRSEHIIGTLERLRMRIEERFPGSGLGKVAEELNAVALAIVGLVEQLSRPLWPIRILTFVAITLLIGLTGWICTLTLRYIPAGESGLMEILQGAESAINEVIFLALAILFFATLENRIKRKAALNSLHRLRSIAHVVDMHQLTKDPASLLADSQKTASSPELKMTPYQLTRYLDYCSELLAINSKLAALHIQQFQDAEVQKTVDEVESLSHELSNKIWQKIMMLDAAKKRK
ncbi:MAG: hypothetical protein IT258_17090 [Saprospiraceae bacterium]|nr:hypothetical protein [Saprospiraceae bacterium]